ncbi:hypothetical protein SNEBB_003149 [Seison nebaliae]|nr:hypothetical protein SNEBB_003149 [Seison nebaliae]
MKGIRSSKSTILSSSYQNNQKNPIRYRSNFLESTRLPPFESTRIEFDENMQLRKYLKRGFSISSMKRKRSISKRQSKKSSRLSQIPERENVMERNIYENFVIIPQIDSSNDDCMECCHCQCHLWTRSSFSDSEQSSNSQYNVVHLPLTSTPKTNRSPQTTMNFDEISGSSTPKAKDNLRPLFSSDEGLYDVSLESKESNDDVERIKRIGQKMRLILEGIDMKKPSTKPQIKKNNSVRSLLKRVKKENRQNYNRPKKLAKLLNDDCTVWYL